MRKRGIALLLAATLLLTSSCARVYKAEEPVVNDKILAEATVAPTVTTAEKQKEYKYITGMWGTDGKSKDDILFEGGTYITIKASEDGFVTGTVCSIQETSQRIAMLDFNGAMKDNCLTYQYEEDGFDNSGTLELKFAKDSITVSNKQNLGNANSSGWCIQSTTLTKVSD